MFYRHWKKIILALTAFFWSACENSDDAVATYGCLSYKCYNSTIVTPSGKVVDIIECDNRYKFLRHPKLYYEDPEVREMMDEDLFFTEYTPTPDERCEASNCKFIGPEICYDMSYNDENRNVHSYDICVATVDCPEKK